MIDETEVIRTSGSIENVALTYADLASFPDDGLRRELIDGELLVTPSPRISHQEVVGNLYVAFRGYLDGRGGGKVFGSPVDVIFSARNVVVPDVVFVGAHQLDILTPLNIQGVPALLIEVLSKPRVDRIRKRDLYERFGVPEYWIAHPDAEWVEVYRLVGDRFAKPEIFEPGDVLPYQPLEGFELDIRALFTPPHA